jgi:hypothetical protein
VGVNKLETANLMRMAARRIDSLADLARAADPTGERWEAEKIYDESWNVWPLYLMDHEKPVNDGRTFRSSDWRYPDDQDGTGGIRVNDVFARHIAAWDPPPAKTVARLLRAMADFVEQHAERDVPTVFAAEFERLAREILRATP